MKNFFNKLRIATFAVISVVVLFTSCTKEDAYVLKQQDITINIPVGGLSTKVGKLLRVSLESVSDDGVSYQWFLDGEKIAETKNLEYMIEVAGEYKLLLEASMGQKKFKYENKVVVGFDEVTSPEEGATAYITKVLDFMPGVGQFTNKLPEYKEGDTQESMNKKVFERIGNNKKGMISLGGFGGYVIVGFDHTIKNIIGKRDFRILANAFYANSNPDSNAPKGGSCEPGIIMVAYDANRNGVADDNEWYEIAGSSHEDPSKELWYKKAIDNGNDINIYFDYEITYYRPDKEPTTDEEMKKYIRWEDNKGNKGYKVKNVFHRQNYFPLWAKNDKITFKGTRLPQNGIDESGAGNYYVLYNFLYGYADNAKNDDDESAIDISWAVNNKRQKVNLPGVDFIKIYTGVNQENGWLGECSTEITGVEDLHILKIDIDTRK